ncbi:MAG: hypothetical protein KA214_09130 [Neisseriaceae bacterium]|nr:hypothetical protein [Neisseriaceae bacterium]
MLGLIDCYMQMCLNSIFYQKAEMNTAKKQFLTCLGFAFVTLLMCFSSDQAMVMPFIGLAVVIIMGALSKNVLENIVGGILIWMLTAMVLMVLLGWVY